MSIRRRHAPALRNITRFTRWLLTLTTSFLHRIHCHTQSSLPRADHDYPHQFQSVSLQALIRHTPWQCSPPPQPRRLLQRPRLLRSKEHRLGKMRPKMKTSLQEKLENTLPAQTMDNGSDFLPRCSICATAISSASWRILCPQG